jgi:prepilin-type N-terminal cleavage/methylation domain-containing protein
MSPARPATQSQAGFSLVETLIATAIVATMSLMFYQSVTVNARALNAIGDRRAAALVAQSALDLAVAGSSSRDLPRSGIDGQMRWQIDIETFQPRTGAAPPLELITVTVTPNRALRPVLRLRSLRLGR